MFRCKKCGQEALPDQKIHRLTKYCNNCALEIKKQRRLERRQMRKEAKQLENKDISSLAADSIKEPIPVAEGQQTIDEAIKEPEVIPEQQ